MVLLTLASGALVGAVLGIIGGGGSILALPLLVCVVGFEGDPHVAIGTTALAVAASATAGLAQHRRAGNVRWRAGLWFALPGVLGALIGAKLGLATRAESLLLLFAILMLVVAWRMWRTPERKVGRRVPRVRPFRRSVVAASGILVGAVSGFFGIGGGFLIVPALYWAAKLDTREAIGTSLVAVGAFGLATAARYALAGQIDLPVAGLFIAGGAIGGLVGARVGRALPARALRLAFAAMLVPVAAYMIFRNYAAFA